MRWRRVRLPSGRCSPVPVAVRARLPVAGLSPVHAFAPYIFIQATAAITITARTMNAIHHPHARPAHNASGAAMDMTTSHRGTPRVFFGVAALDPVSGVVAGFVAAGRRRRSRDRLAVAAVIPLLPHPRRPRSSPSGRTR
jgi:hypothetical protein